MKLDQRMANADEVDALVESWTVTKGKKEVAEIVRKHGVASGVVADIPDVLADPQLIHRGMIVDLFHPELGKVEGAVGHDIPVRLSESKGGFDLPAPYLGAHNEEVYCGLLGYSREEVRQLEKDGIIAHVSKSASK
jgi:crotonobetainyl-CoA:carnitine CoA-transferase CaiB-like acyl-CoA transferase